MEDESSLEKKVNFSSRFPILVLLLIAFTILAGSFGVFILASTPLKNHLPGYLKESERTATEEQHLRLDSLVHVYEVNEAYINGILSALYPSETSGVPTKERKSVPFSVDSLIPVSEEERAFMENIRERDKYNIVYSSPSAAQTMLFGNVNKSAVISEDSKNKIQAEILLPVNGTVSAVAEGKVISVASSPKTSGGYEMIIQHPKGFLSKTGRLTNLTVKPGDRVSAGQIVALGAVKDGMKSNLITLELWHDGDPLKPSQYIGN